MRQRSKAANPRHSTSRMETCNSYPPMTPSITCVPKYRSSSPITINTTTNLILLACFFVSFDIPERCQIRFLHSAKLSFRRIEGRWEEQALSATFVAGGESFALGQKAEKVLWSTLHLFFLLVSRSTHFFDSFGVGRGIGVSRGGCFHGYMKSWTASDFLLANSLCMMLF